VRVIGSSLQARRLPISACWVAPSEIASSVPHIVQRDDWDVLVVDTFPRGLLGELAPLVGRLGRPSVLVHRDISPLYWQRFDLESFVAAYDLVLLPGERGPLARHRASVFTDPWLIRDADELLAPAAARARLGVASHDRRPLVLVSASGTDLEIDHARGLAARLGRLLPEALVRAVAPGSPANAVWPLLELLPGVDALVGAGGYNTVHETRATCTPLLAVPRRRVYDRQARRLRPAERLADEDLLVSRLTELLNGPSAPPRPPPRYVNGVHAAVERIERLVAPAASDRASASEGALEV
jgi:hypothetical protein